MSLKKRLILILSGVGLILAAAFHFSINLTMIPDLEEQKKIIISRLHDKLKESLEIEKRSLHSLGDNWAKWHDLRDYIDNPNNTFEEVFLSDSSFLSHILNTIVILAPDGRMIFDKNYRDDVKFFFFPRLKIEPAFEKIKTRVRQTGRPFTAMVNSGFGPLLMTAHPVNSLHSNTTGMLILGRFMDKKRLNKGFMRDDEEIRLVSFKETQLIDFYLKQMGDKDMLYREDKKRMTLFLLVKDLFGQPSLLLTVETRNRLLWVAKQHTVWYIVFTLLAMIILGFLLYYLIGRFINRRIYFIAREMKRVRELPDHRNRLESDKYGDEISALAAEFNAMLDAIDREKTSRQNMEKRLIMDEKLVSIGRLTASIAHEINNPMLAISNCFQVMKRVGREYSGSDSNKFQKALELSEREINRIRNIISSLLDFNRMEVEEFREIDLDGVLLESLEVLKWSNKLNAVKIITKKKNQINIFGSPGKLKQVFINFILNSVEASKKDDKIQLRIELAPSKDHGYCEIHFRDNGPGVPENIKNKLFEPFVSSKLEKGVGLGLYVSYKIIENHRGEIIYDETYKKGSHFIVKLPVLSGLKETEASGSS